MGNNLFLIGSHHLTSSGKEVWMCEGVFDNEKSAVENCKKDEFVIEIAQNKRLPEYVDDAICVWYPHYEGKESFKKKLENIVENNKQIIKSAIKDITLVNHVSRIKDLHPTTLKEIEGHVHQIQNILIAEYVRYTDLKEELGLV